MSPLLEPVIVGLALVSGLLCIVALLVGSVRRRPDLGDVHVDHAPNTSRERAEDAEAE